MLTIIKNFLEKVDILKLIEFLRKRNNRKIAANLNHALVYSHEIIEIYETIFHELKEALDDHQQGKVISLNPARIQSLLERQAGNLEKLEECIHSAYYSTRVLDNEFYEQYAKIIPGKFGFLFHLQGVLAGGRMFLNEGDTECFRHDEKKTYKTLWFTWDKPTEDRKEIEKYLYGYSGKDLKVIDLNNHDGKKFFELIEWYFKEQNPVALLNDLKSMTDSYKKALMDNFDISDILSDVERKWI
jgi:hypothetical protein